MTYQVVGDRILMWDKAGRLMYVRDGERAIYLEALGAGEGLYPMPGDAFARDGGWLRRKLAGPEDTP